jgi:hypothetical protein
MTSTKPDAHIGGYRREVDFQKFGPALLPSCCAPKVVLICVNEGFAAMVLARCAAADAMLLERGRRLSLDG